MPLVVCSALIKLPDLDFAPALVLISTGVEATGVEATGAGGTEVEEAGVEIVSAWEVFWLFAGIEVQPNIKTAAAVAKLKFFVVINFIDMPKIDSRDNPLALILP